MQPHCYTFGVRTLLDSQHFAQGRESKPWAIKFHANPAVYQLILRHVEIHAMSAQVADHRDCATGQHHVHGKLLTQLMSAVQKHGVSLCGATLMCQGHPAYLR